MLCFESGDREQTESTVFELESDNEIEIFGPSGRMWHITR